MNKLLKLALVYVVAVVGGSAFGFGLFLFSDWLLGVGVEMFGWNANGADTVAVAFGVVGFMVFSGLVFDEAGLKW